jgi:hypothetical protein
MNRNRGFTVTCTGGSATVKLQNIFFFPMSADLLDYSSGVAYVGNGTPATFETTKQVPRDYPGASVARNFALSGL